MKVLKYKEYLNESKGIADDVIELKNIIMKDVIKFINIFKPLFEIKDYGFTKKFFEFYSYSNDKLKLENLMVEIDLIKKKEYITTGYNRNNESEFKKDVLYNSIIHLRVELVDFNENEIDNIETSLVHELLHVYQTYNIENKRQPSEADLAHTGIKHTEIYKEHEDLYLISSLLYLTTKIEIKAYLHEYYVQKTKYKNPKGIYQIIDMITSFDINKINIDEEFILGIESIRKKYYEYITEYSPNNTYTKNVNRSIWSRKITNKNVLLFLNHLKELFDDSLKFIYKKIKQIDSKIGDLKYTREGVDYSFLMILKENVDDYVISCYRYHNNNNINSDRLRGGTFYSPTEYKPDMFKTSNKIEGEIIARRPFIISTPHGWLHDCTNSSYYLYNDISWNNMDIKKIMTDNDIKILESIIFAKYDEDIIPYIRNAKFIPNNVKNDIINIYDENDKKYVLFDLFLIKILKNKYDIVIVKDSKGKTKEYFDFNKLFKQISYGKIISRN